MSQVSLTKLLKCRRKDLSDGFVVKRCRLVHEHKRLKNLAEDLNSVFLDEDIEFVITKEPSSSTCYGEFGIYQAECSVVGTITIYLYRTFLKKFYGPDAEDVYLGLQGIIAHELTHREQFSTTRALFYGSDTESTLEEYMTDPFELEAFAAEIAHELRINKLDFNHEDATMVSWRYRELVDFYTDTKYSHQWPAIRNQIEQIFANR